MLGDVDIREIAGCTCLRLRRLSRITTQVYEAHIGKAGLTIGQFGLLAQLHGVSVRQATIGLKALAQLAGMDPTTLVRTLKPLERSGWISNANDPEDRRSRLLRITDEGRDRLSQAIPHWQAAQHELRGLVGEETALALNGLLDLAGRKLQGT